MSNSHLVLHIDKSAHFNGNNTSDNEFVQKETGQFC